MDSSKEFFLRYIDSGGCTLHYYNYEPDTGCYMIQLSTNEEEVKWRIFVADDDGNNRDLDTSNYYVTPAKRLCTKWLRIHVKG